MLNYQRVNVSGRGSQQNFMFPDPDHRPWHRHRRWPQTSSWLSRLAVTWMKSPSQRNARDLIQRVTVWDQQKQHCPTLFLFTALVFQWKSARICKNRWIYHDLPAKLIEIFLISLSDPGLSLWALPQPGVDNTKIRLVSSSRQSKGILRRPRLGSKKRAPFWSSWETINYNQNWSRWQCSSESSQLHGMIYL